MAKTTAAAPQFITSRQAAEIAGISHERFRNKMTRERQKGNNFRAPREEWIDARTPTYDRAAIEAWGRHGTGVPANS